MHHFPSMTWDEIMWYRSWANLQMLMATIPSTRPRAGSDGYTREIDSDNRDEMASYFNNLNF